MNERIPIYVGKWVRFSGKEYQVVNFGGWGVRIERGYGTHRSVLIVQQHQLKES